jgi:hypothetical protein
MTDLLYDDVEVSLYIPFVPGGSGPFSGDRPLTMAFEAGIDYNSSMSDETRKGGSMERRDFIRKTLACGGAAGLSLGGPTLGAGAERAASTAWSDPQVDKVKIAMLSMQRMAWEQGTAAQAILEWGDPDLVVLMAKEAVVRISEDGRLGQINDNHGVTDPGSNGEAVLYAAKLTGDPALKAGADRMLDYLINKAPKTKDGTLYHIDDRPQVWIDSMYMAPPFLAVAGRPDEAMKQIEGFRKLLWNKEKQLFSHIWDDAKRDFGRRAFWGVGNGWAAAGMTRVLNGRSLPATSRTSSTVVSPGCGPTGSSMTSSTTRNHSLKRTSPRSWPTRSAAVSRTGDSMPLIRPEPIRCATPRARKWIALALSGTSAARRRSRLPGPRPKARPSSS